MQKRQRRKKPQKYESTTLLRCQKSCMQKKSKSTSFSLSSFIATRLLISNPNLFSLSLSLLPSLYILFSQAPLSVTVYLHIMTKLLLALSLSLFVSAAFGLRSPRLSEAQQCRLQRLTASQPSRVIQSEGGQIELWDQSEDQFQCAGVAPKRVTLRPNTVHLPSYHPNPHLVYVLQGQGLLGLTIPGCAETFSSQQQQRPRGQGGQQGQEEYQQGQQGPDLSQRVRHIRPGDVVAIPAGAAHWCANHDNQQDLVVIAIHDLNHLSNQLDQRHRAFYLAGGRSREQDSFDNIFRAFDPELLSEAFNAPVDTIRKMQREDERGPIVNAQQGLSSIIRPGRRQEEVEEWGGGRGQPMNGIEETTCSMRIHTNIDRYMEEADVYSRQAGKVTTVDKLKLPILKYLDLSMEKGELFPDAIVSPHWTMNGHTVFYVIRGDAQLEAVNYNGENVMNDRVNKGDMVVVPQFFAATIRAGRNGFEWVAVKTTATPMKNALAGYTSVLRAQPLEVLEHSYRISPGDAQQLKHNRGSESILLSSSQQRQRPYN